MARLHDKFRQEIMPVLAEKLGRTNPMSLPRLQKIVVNMGVGKAVQEKARMEQAADQLGQIAGQRPQITKSKRAVSGFRLRENIEIGCRVTLRGKRMYEFFDVEQNVFPEINPDKVTFTQGMDVTFVTTTNKDDEARELLRAFGMPFRDK